jgi:membrane protein
MKLQEIPNLFKEAGIEWFNDNVPRLGAALAYYMIFALAPLLVIAVGIAGVLFGRQAVSGHVAEQLQTVVDAQSAKLIETMVANASKPRSGIFATVVGVIVLIFGAMGLFGELQADMDAIWKVQPKPGRGIMGFLKDRLLSMAMVLASALLLLASLVLTAVVAAVGKRVGSGNAVLGSYAMTLGISWVVITLLFAMVYRFLPDARVTWKDVWFGAIVTSVLFSIGKFLIGLYLAHASVGSVYGAAGSLAVLLVWLYYSAQIFFYGAELTKVFARHYGGGIIPTDNAELIECKPVSGNESRHDQRDMDQIAARISAGSRSTHTRNLDMATEGGTR